jgi:hypothetical protein
MGQPWGIHCGPRDPGCTRFWKGTYPANYCGNCGNTCKRIMHGCRDKVNFIDFAEKTQGDMPAVPWNRLNARSSSPQTLGGQ